MTKEELGSLILASERQMYATAKTILNNDMDCADAIQEAILKAFSSIHQLRQDKYAKTWLIRILINECHLLIRKKGNAISYDEYMETNEDAAAEVKDYSTLYTALNHLHEELRLPVTLYYVEELSVREIAAILEISEGAVQKRLMRAREKMRNEMLNMEEIL